ncbi:MAG: hypothetical protein HUJ51_05010 [Eggerthellaceae bacterium]|nr:hypothetical protein [Eggerthellaceae bacterium]
MLPYATKSHIAGNEVYGEDEHFYFKEIKDYAMIEFSKHNIYENAIVKELGKIIVSDVTNLLAKLPPWKMLSIVSQ